MASMNERGFAELEVTLGSIGWQKVIAPTLKQELLDTLDQLGAVNRKVPEGVSAGEWDNFLRGRVDGIKFVLHNFVAQLAEYKRRSAEDQQEQVAEPAVGSPYDPAANPPVEG